MCSSPFQMKWKGKTCMQMDLVFTIAFFKWSDVTPHKWCIPSTSPCKVRSIYHNGYWEGKVLHYMDGVQTFSANFFIPTLMDFEKDFDTFFTLVDGCENLKYHKISMDSKLLSYGGLFGEFFTVVNCMSNLKDGYSHACPFCAYKFMLNSQCFLGLSNIHQAWIKIFKVASFAKHSNLAMPLKRFYFWWAKGCMLYWQHVISRNLENFEN